MQTNRITEYGPLLGYYPKASKTWLVVKKDKYEEAQKLFENTGINITTEGRKYLGGFVGTKIGAETYVNNLQEKWLEELNVLTEIAKSEPQSAYAAFTSGFRHKMTYFMRTIPNLQDVLKPLDKFITEKFIPAITEGHILSSDDRKLLSLPVRMGGMGIPIFTESCIREYSNSLDTTKALRENIIAQVKSYHCNKKFEKEITAKIISAKQKYHEDILSDLRTRMNKDQIRGNDVAQMKGASAWLNSLPLKDEGYRLSKREFFDAIALRYRWMVKRLPTNCACSQKFNIDHAMQCKTGGYIHRRHDQLRDLFADLIDEVSNEVEVEPELQPLSGESLPNGANRNDEARSDIATRGFWQKCEKAFFDVKVFNPFAKSHMNQNLKSVFNSNERQKKLEYNRRIIQIEHGSFTPLVVSAFGGFGGETSVFISKLIEKLSEKKGDGRSIVANYVRTKISFSLVRSQIACIRGSRGRKRIPVNAQEMNIVTNTSRILE